MNEHDIRLVQQSFERTKRIAPHLAATFYSELFGLDPTLRAMFKGDMIAQGQKLMNTLTFIVSNLNAPDVLLPAARALAVKHLEYGVEARHYALVGTALIRALRHELGFDFTQDIRTAWTNAYGTLSEAMREAAYGAAPTR